MVNKKLIKQAVNNCMARALRKARRHEDHGSSYMSQAEVAQVLGVSQSWISQLEKSQKPVRDWVLYSLCRHKKINVKLFLPDDHDIALEEARLKPYEGDAPSKGEDDE